MKGLSRGEVSANTSGSHCRYGKVAADLTPTDDFFSDKDSQAVQVFFHATHSKTIPIRS